MGGSQVETARLREVQKASLGESLVAARERRGLSRETAVQETHIPARYVQMLEDDDYRRISDQLYLLPFLRKYASFLDIDQDETAMRLLREVQRVDNSLSPVRLAEPLDDIRGCRGRNWTTPVLFSGLIAVIIGAYIAQSRHDDSDAITALKLQSAEPAVASPSSASRGTVKSTAAQSVNAASVRELDSSAPRQTTFGKRASTQLGTLSITQAMVVPLATQGEPPNLPKRKTQDARQGRNP